jgi:CubicO group peptidase (beta-lactamase class C family)
LLSHRSGLARGDRLWYGSEYDRNEVLRRVRYLKPSWSLRARFGYQNIMFLAAGQIIPSVTGKTWDDFLRERIFTPLNMKDTSTSIKSFAGSTNVATPHAKLDDKVRPISWRNIDNIAPAGSINSSVQDMAQWIRLNLGEGVYEKQRLLSAASIKEMQTPQSIVGLDGPRGSLYPEAHFLTYGLGWFLSDYKGRKLVEHGGAIDGMRAQVGMIPEEKLGLVVLTNLHGTTFPHALMYKILDIYLKAPERDWCAEMLKVEKRLEEQGKAAEKKAEAERVKDTSPSLPLEKYVGTFESDMYGQIKVALDNQKLVVRFGPNFTGDLQHWHFDTFRVAWRDQMQGKGFVSFKLNTQGKASVLSIENLSEFTRVREPDPKAVTSAKN